MGSLEDFAETLGYQEGDSLLRLREALQSATDSRSRNQSNRRLAWLGDAVVDLVVSKRAFLTHAKPTLADLHHEHQEFVPKRALSDAAIELKLHRHLEPELSEADAKIARETMESVFEAIAAALYLDKGFLAAEKFVDGALRPLSVPR